MESVETIKNRHGIGAVVFWALHDVRVRRADMRATFEAQGLGAAVQRDPSPSACLTRAVSRAAVGRPAVRFERVRDDGAVATEALSVLATDAATETATYTQIGTISVDKQTGAVAFSKNGDDYGALEAAAGEYHEAREWCSTADLGAALKIAMYGRARNLLLGAVNLRGQSGGVYYVRESRMGAVEALAAWIDASGFGKLTILRITEEGSGQVGNAARSTILERIAEVTSGLDELVEKINGASEDELDRILEPTLARFDLISQQVDLYADVLGLAREELIGKADLAKKAILSRCVAA